MIGRLFRDATNPQADKRRIPDVTLSGRNGVTRRKIAVIGGGISGLTAGYILSRTDESGRLERAGPERWEDTGEIDGDRNRPFHPRSAGAR